jgi:hypothetical protein
MFWRKVMPASAGFNSKRVNSPDSYVVDKRMDVYSSPNIMRVMKTRRMGRAWSTHGGEEELRGLIESWKKINQLEDLHMDRG